MYRKSKKKSIVNVSKALLYDTNALIFSFINPNGNDILSKMSGEDLQDLIVLMDDYYIMLRKQIGIKKDITFGLEIEVEHAKEGKINYKLSKEFSKCDDWERVYDGSLDDGVEINSPIMKDNPQNWRDLEKVLSIVEPFASIDTSCGGHIHVGTPALGSKSESWLNFLELWSVYENIIFRFAYGNFLTARPNITEYAAPIASRLWSDYLSLKESGASFERIINRISYKRYNAVNFCRVDTDNCDNFEKDNTIEFRCPNGSLDPAIWQNNVNLFVKMLCYSRSTAFNDDVVKQRQKSNSDSFAELELYDEIYLDQALEFCDMVFSNNLDKINFLKQYLKSFQICKAGDKYPKAHALTKK